VAAGAARYAMGLDEVMIVAGIGCRKNIAADEVLAAVDAALAAYALERAALSALATASFKGEERAIVAAAEVLRLPLITVAEDEMKRVADGSLSHSDASLAVSGIASVSECAALAAAGEGGRLLGQRVAVGNATCAIAQGRDTR